MDKIKLLEAAKMYASQKLNAFFEYEEYYCATDGRLLAMVPKHMVTSEIEIKTEDVPNFSFVLTNQPLNGDVKLRLGDLIDRLNEVPMIDEIDDCEICDGYGKVECDCCGHQNDCKECDGTGDGKPNGSKELDYDYHLKIVGSHLNSTIVHRLTTGLVHSGYNHDSMLTILSNNDPQPMVMDIDGIKIVAVVTHSEIIEKEKVIKVL
jgi:hypothetical protein